MRRNGPIIISLLSLISICVLADFALANDYLWLITTITPGRDSTQITSVTPVGDYNADGHGDLLVGLRGTAGAHPWFEAADLYFGGPDFDSLPDVRFFGDPQNLDLCDLPGYQETCFGSVATPLGDFNGDSYDDFAVSAIAYCNHTVVGGRVYIYLGGPAADTMPDLVIDTYQDYDAFGYFLDDGDFNGDGLGDLLTGTRDVFYGQRVYIYLGGAPPDTIHDWLCDYSGQHAHLANQSGGFDTDGDGFDDFAWQDQATTPVSWHFFRGGAPPSPQPYFTTQEFSLGFREFDVSGDGVDDFFLGGDGGYYLCLGGAPLDFGPDYPAAGFIPIAAYARGGGDTALLAVDRRNERLKLLHRGVPPDTVPLVNLPYDSTLWPMTQPVVGDLDADGIDDLALLGPAGGPYLMYAKIYSIMSSNAAEDDSGPGMPQNSSILRCYPDPFNSTTMITIEGAGEVEIAIFDIIGRKVASLQTQHGKAVWEAEGMSSGVYFARADKGQTGTSAAQFNVIKLVYLK